MYLKEILYIMIKLSGTNINLRALEPTDLEFLYEIENNEGYWEISNTQTPYSKFILKQYIENSHLDIYEAKQLRLIIETKNKEVIGAIDLFDFNPQHLRAGIGILISPKNQQKGYAAESIEIICNYAFTYLNLKQLYANINTNNKKSIQLFEKFKFKSIGIRKDWILVNGKFQDVAFYQLISPTS